MMLGEEMLVDVDASNFRSAAAIGRVSATSPYQVGDVVFLHGGFAGRGIEATVVDVEESRERVTIELAPEDDLFERGRERAEFEDITLVRPLRRDPLPDYLAVVDRSRFLCGQQRPLQHWAVMQLRAVGWDLAHPSLAAGGALAEEFGALEQRTWDEAIAEHEARRRELLASFEPLGHEERVERWKAEWKMWAGCDYRELPPIPPEWDEVVGDDSESRRKRDMAFALRERFERKPWSA